MQQKSLAICSAVLVNAGLELLDELDAQKQYKEKKARLAAFVQNTVAAKSILAGNPFFEGFDWNAVSDVCKVVDFLLYVGG